MSDKEEMINLDYELACKLFGKHAWEYNVKTNGCAICGLKSTADVHVWQPFHKDYAAAMQVLEKCIKKVDVHIYEITEGQWRMQTNTKDISVEGSTLCLVISNFAKALFTT